MLGYHLPTTIIIPPPTPFILLHIYYYIGIVPPIFGSLLIVRKSKHKIYLVVTSFITWYFVLVKQFRTLSSAHSTPSAWRLQRQRACEPQLRANPCRSHRCPGSISCRHNREPLQWSVRQRNQSQCKERSQNPAFHPVHLFLSQLPLWQEHFGQEYVTFLFMFWSFVCAVCCGDKQLICKCCFSFIFVVGL